jgi:hypothetical protein
LRRWQNLQTGQRSFMTTIMMNKMIIPTLKNERKMMMATASLTMKMISKTGLMMSGKYPR